MFSYRVESAHYSDPAQSYPGQDFALDLVQLSMANDSVNLVKLVNLYKPLTNMTNLTNTALSALHISLRLP